MAQTSRHAAESDPLLTQLAAKILRNLPTLYFAHQREIKLISPEKTWCLSQLQIPQIDTLTELKKTCRRTPQVSCLFFLNSANLTPQQLVHTLGASTPTTLFIPLTTDA